MSCLERLIKFQEPANRCRCLAHFLSLQLEGAQLCPRTRQRTGCHEAQGVGYGAAPGQVAAEVEISGLARLLA
jgi:hypothetical protein